METLTPEQKRKFVDACQPGVFEFVEATSQVRAAAAAAAAAAAFRERAAAVGIDVPIITVLTPGARCR
jgi:hypothetical protein